MEDTEQIIVIILTILVSIIGTISKKKKELKNNKMEKAGKKARTQREVFETDTPDDFMEETHEGEHSLPTEPLLPTEPVAPEQNTSCPPVTAAMNVEEPFSPAADLCEELADNETLKKAVIYREILTPKFQNLS